MSDSQGEKWAKGMILMTILKSIKQVSSNIAIVEMLSQKRFLSTLCVEQLHNNDQIIMIKFCCNTYCALLNKWSKNSSGKTSVTILFAKNLHASRTICKVNLTYQWNLKRELSIFRSNITSKNLDITEMAKVLWKQIYLHLHCWILAKWSKQYLLLISGCWLWTIENCC